MPTTSSSFFQPLVTPSTALNTSARARPCSAACESVCRSTCSTPSFSESVMPCGISAETLPFGPSTTTVFVWTVYLTPLGSVMGFLPIRDIVKILFGLRVPRSQKPLVPLQRCELKVRGGELPDFAENLAANTLTARLTSGHDTLRSRHNRDTQPALNAANLILADVHTAAGARNALQVADDSLIVRAVLQVNAQLL